jgi:hypothetical protein
MNFLTRLIERHRPEPSAPLPVLEPRVPSRFEPVAQIGLSPALDPNVEVDVRRHAESGIRPTPSHPWLRARPHQPDQPPPMSDPLVSRLRSALDAALSPIDLQSSRITPDERSNAPELTQHAATARPGSTPARGDVDSSAVPSAEQRPTPLHPAPPPMPIPRPDLQPRWPPSTREGRDRGTGQAAAEPTVHVTIGRIDVRAVMPAAPPPSRTTAKGTGEKLSLADYLHGRARAHR